MSTAFQATPENDRWQNGFSFVPEHCAEPESVIIPCVGGNPAGGPDATVLDSRGPGGSAEMMWTPYLVRSSFKCDAQQRGTIDFERRARRILELGESKLIETELYRGDAAGWAQNDGNPAFDPPNLSLVTPAAVGTTDVGLGGATTPSLGIRALLQAAANTPGAHHSMLHCTPDVAEAWMQGGSIARNRDGSLVTTMGQHRVVVGTGYTGAGPGNADPGGTTQYAWITSPVYLLMGDIEIHYDMDRGANDGRAIATRPVCAYWDGCLHAGIQIDAMGTVV